MAFGDQRARSSMRHVLTQVPEQQLSPPIDIRDEISWTDFSGIENPFGTPASFVNAMGNALKDGIVSYPPDRDAHTLRSELARGLGMPVESFLVGTTVSDMIRAVAQAYEPCTVGVTMPCPVEYVLAVSNTGHRMERIASPASFVTPDAEMLRSRNVHIDAAILANPSYPTSRLLPKSTLKTYLDSCAWVIVDERSIELTLGGESMAPLVREYKNLVVVQSFTEQYAMSGAPISYCIAHPDTIAEFSSFYDSSGVSMFAEVLAEPSALERFKLDDIREFLDSEIPWMQCMLSLVPGIDIFPAEANYVMCTFHNSGDLRLAVNDVSELSAQLQLKGFLIRELDGTPGLPKNGYFCVAVKTREENERLIEALREVITPAI